MKRPQVIAANKMDIPEAEENLKRLKEAYEPQGYQVFPISAASNQGLDELLGAVAQELRNYPEDIVFEDIAYVSTLISISNKIGYIDKPLY